MTDEPVILVCARIKGPLMLPDNLTGKCDQCGRLVEYRPHAPKPHILRCIQCAVPMIEDGDEIGSTPQMIEDAKTYFRRKLQ